MEQKPARSGGANTASGLTTTDPRRSVMATSDPTLLPPQAAEQPAARTIPLPYHGPRAVRADGSRLVGQPQRR